MKKNKSNQIPRELLEHRHPNRIHHGNGSAHFVDGGWSVVKDGGYFGHFESKMEALAALVTVPEPPKPKRRRKGQTQV